MRTCLPAFRDFKSRGGHVPHAAAILALSLALAVLPLPPVPPAPPLPACVRQREALQLRQDLLTANLARQVRALPRSRPRPARVLARPGP